MKFYAWMSRLPLPSIYLVKILAISFIGVHVPMIGAVAYILVSADIALQDTMGVMLAMLIATLVGTVGTMAMLYLLLAPITTAAQALRAYLENRTVPALPTRYADEAGVLLANVQEAVTRLDVALDTARAQRDAALREHRDKFEVLAGMSHDLRTPLNHVIGFAELMSSEALGPLGSSRYKSYAGDISSSGGDLLVTLQHILELSAVEAERSSADLSAINLAAAVQQAARLTHFQADILGAVVTEQLDPFAGPTVMVDERSLKQILLHALQVALAGPSGARGLTIAVSEADGRGSVTIEGTQPWGPGDIPPELAGASNGASNGGSPGPDSGARTGTGDAFEGTTQTALRLSLIRSLVQSGGGSVQIAATAPGGRSIALSFRSLDGAGAASRAA